MLVNPVGQNDELQRIGIDQSAARTHRIAILITIGPIGGRDSPSTADVFLRMSGRIGTSQIPSEGGNLGSPDAAAHPEEHIGRIGTSQIPSVGGLVRIEQALLRTEFGKS